MSALTFPKVVADTATMSRETWLDARRYGIGGSDVAAILGVSPWTSRYTLWLDKTGQQPNVVKETPAMAFGTLMEPIIREILAEEIGTPIHDDTLLYRHPEHEFMLANLDGTTISDPLLSEPDTVVEIKTSRREWDNGVPAYYKSQVMHYMAVTGLSHAIVAALFGGETFRTYPLERDEQYIDHMIEKEIEFWESVQHHTKPDIDGSESTHDTLRKAFTAEKGKQIDLSIDAVGLIEQRRFAKEQIARYEDEAREAEARLMEALRDAEIGLVNGKSLVTWKQQSRSGLDTKALKEAHPEIVEQFTTSSTFRVLRVKEAKSDDARQ